MYHLIDEICRRNNEGNDQRNNSQPEIALLRLCIFSLRHAIFQ